MEKRGAKKEELITELEKLRKRIAKLEVLETEHKKAEEELEKKTEQLITLFDLGKKITSLVSKEKLIPWIARQSARLLGADVCKFWLKEGNYLVRGGGTREGMELMQKRRLKIGESLSGIIAKEKRPLAVENVLDEKRYIRKHRDVAKRLGYVSFLGVPMMIAKKTVGVINIYTKNPRKFKKTDIELLSAFADMAALALVNAKLFRDLEQEIAERKLAEEKIQESLEEKEILLKEVYNRVRNNLEVTSSLLALQSGLIKDKETAHIYRECQDRLKTMVLAHEKIYRTKEIAKIDFRKYIIALTKTLFYSYGADTDKIALKIDIDDTFLDIDTAIPCGLIINEFVTNSLKHAFPEGREGEIEISFHQKGKDKLELKVRNNGIALPEDFGFRNAKSIGLQMINILVNQLQGEVRINRDVGAEFQILFSEERQRRD
ncbi:MAG TPA: histidine kinase dimerization/phosphoacceptor domain -containing protein [Nitrospinota bacterium]|nr:histidine kinase dimerization/phosphoacceptor domain -containing protein [Nitrospinota bacterium]